jgi:hypothetical protein
MPTEARMQIKIPKQEDSMSEKKNDLWVKLSDPDVISYVRRQDESCTTVVERAMRRKLGLKALNKEKGRIRKKDPRNLSGFPVRINDPRLVSHIVGQRKKGVIHRYTVENAVREAFKAEKED